MADYSKDLYDYKYECRRNCSAFDDGYNQALEDFGDKMAHFCFGLKASQGNMCRVDVVEDELQKVKIQLKK